MMDIKIETMILDSVDAAIGSQGGVIVVRDAEERTVAQKYLEVMARRANVPGADKTTEIVVIPGAKSIHWRAKLVYLGDELLTPEEESDLFDILRSGRARLWRNLAQETLKSVGAKAEIPYQSLARWERGAYPMRAVSRERYYRLLCEWRERYGEISVADER